LEWWRDYQLVDVACDMCGGEQVQVLGHRPDGLRLVQCSRCNLAYISPRPSEEALTAIYSNGAYFGIGKGRSGIGYLDYAAGDRQRTLLALAEARLAALAAHVSLRGQRLLEIGCATGEFCKAASDAGGRVVGLDCSPEAVEIGAMRYPGVTFRSGKLEDLVPDATFDIICAFEVIEHVASPTLFLGAINRHLARSGIVALSTPNLDCGFRLGLPNWEGFCGSFEHMYFFTARTLSALLQKNGFNPIAFLSGGGTGRRRESLIKNVRAKLSRTFAARAFRLLFGRARSDAPMFRAGVGEHTLLVIAKRM